MSVDPHQAARLAGLLVEKASVDASIAAGPPAPELALLQVHLANCVSELAEARLDPGTKNANRQALQTAAGNAIADLNTAESLVVANGWDGLTPAQRKAIALGEIRDIRALIRLSLNLLDSPS